MQIIQNINPYIFRGYDIRGVYPETINEDVAYTVGKSYGSYIQDLGKKECVIGHDNRLSSEALTNALIQGILETGVHVTDLGLVTTPMYYDAWIELDIPSGIMVTASHNPKDDNGFKFSFDERGNAKGEMIEAFYQYTIKGDFKEGKGTLKQYNIRNSYLELMKKSLSFGDRKVKAVIDLGNGTTSIIAKEMYEMFPIDVTVIYGESDGTFPNHHPDPCVESNLTGLKQKVLELGADVGIGFDGDGDRLGIVSEKGEYIPTDLFMVLIIRNIIDKVSNKTFLYDVKCSKALEDEIIRLGGTPFCYRTGNSYTKAKVAEMDLAFGGELSGHVYFRDKFPGFDSGLYAGLRLLELLSKTDKSVSELLEGIPTYYSTEEIKFASPDDIKASVVEKVRLYCEEKGYSMLTIDGIRVQFEDGWALVRMSNTGPNITARFEANTKERLEQIQREFTEQIEKYNK
ncbi:MAG: phosphomannomutase/phosphoglucomutase [Bacilli bacterium]|nr:phosphomannomutase/phosphoglucomutase [Bacilli bacterium]